LEKVALTNYQEHLKPVCQLKKVKFIFILVTNVILVVQIFFIPNQTGVLNVKRGNSKVKPRTQGQRKPGQAKRPVRLSSNLTRFAIRVVVVSFTRDITSACLAREGARNFNTLNGQY